MDRAGGKDEGEKGAPRTAFAAGRCLLKARPQLPDVEYVFPSSRRGPLSDMALTQLMRRHGFEAVLHGFRSTFRGWADEMTGHPCDAIELCLAHAIDTKTEAAYRRGDILEKRAVIIQECAKLYRDILSIHPLLHQYIYLKALFTLILKYG